MNKLVKHPPKTGEWLLKRLLPGYVYDDAIHDYRDLYLRIADKNGYFKANIWFWSQILKSSLLFLKESFLWSMVMFGNYIKIALRIFAKHKTYTLINIAGLSLGITGCILIYLYIAHELSFDRFHKKADDVYAIAETDMYYGLSGYTGPPAAVGPVLKEYFPEVLHAVRMNSRNEAVVSYKDKIFRERPSFTDTGFFNVFSFPLIKGDPETALNSINSVVLTETVAQKYFGEEEPMGNSLSFSFGLTEIDLTVTGIVADIPPNSSVRFGILANFQKLGLIRGPEYLTNWDWFDTQTFVRLKKGADPEIINTLFPEFVSHYFTKKLEERLNSGKWNGEGETISLSLKNIQDIHLDSDKIGLPLISDIRNSYILAGIAFLILLIACINFVNLSVGRSSGRAVEISMRKVLGAHKKQLFRQFWIESVFLSALAFVAAVLLAYLLLPVFSELARKELTLSTLLNAKSVLILAVFILVVASVSGSFPALIMSNFRPVEILKGKLKVGGKNFFTRFLIVIQFSLSVFLIISTLTMVKQIDYMNNEELGFSKEGVIVIKTLESDVDKSTAMIDLFRERLNNLNDVMFVSGCWSSFNRMLSYGPIDIEGKPVYVHFNKVQYDFVKTLGLNLLEGRDFSREFSTDATAAIVNEKFVEKFALGSPLRKTVKLGGDMFPEMTIIGVVKDYNFQSLKKEIEPAVICMIPDAPQIYLYHAVVRLTPGQIPEKLKSLENTWQEVFPEKPFEYSILSEDVEAAYSSEYRWNSIVRYSSFIAVLITCMGLFGLTSLTLSRRIKEIGIRKILGATVPQIIYLVMREFILLAVIANIITWPVAWYLMESWLMDFAHRTNIGWSVFILTGLTAVFISLFTALFQSLRSARANPVNSLRYE